MRYDIIQVEDSERDRGFMARQAEINGLSYMGVSCLNDLKSALEGDEARAYIVDGRFPEALGKVVEKNYQEAISLIRSKNSDARIILYSGEMNVSSMAAEENVEFAEKGRVPASELIKKIAGSN